MSPNPIRNRPLPPAPRHVSSPHSRPPQATAFRRLVAWLRTSGLGRILIHYFSSSPPTSPPPRLPTRQSRTSDNNVAVRRQAPATAQGDKAPPKPKRAQAKAQGKPSDSSQTDAANTKHRIGPKQFSRPSYAARRSLETIPEAPEAHSRTTRKGRVRRSRKNKLDRFILPSKQAKSKLETIAETKEPASNRKPPMSTFAKAQLKPPVKPLRGITRHSKANVAPESQEPIYATVDPQARLSKPSAQSVLGYAFQLLEDKWDDPALNKDQQAFCADAYQKLQLYALDKAVKPQDTKSMLNQLIGSEFMPADIGQAIGAELGYMRPSAASNYHQKAHTEFLSQLDTQLAARLADKPPPEALRASALRGDVLYNLLVEQFTPKQVDGQDAVPLEQAPEFQAYLTSLAQTMSKDIPWLVDKSATAQAFVATPNHDTLRAMLKTNQTGADMMRLSWLHTRHVLSRDYRTQQYQNRRANEFHMQPYSYVQQFEFCERQFGIPYRPRAGTLDASPKAELASGIFVAQQLASQFAGRKNAPSGEMFALGHILLAAQQGKLNLRESARIYRAVTSDSRPMVNFINRNPESVVSHRMETSNSKSIEIEHKKALARALPSYWALPTYFSDNGLKRAIDFTLPDALSATIWQGPRARTAGSAPSPATEV